MSPNDFLLVEQALIRQLQAAEPCTSEARRDQLRVVRSLAERACQNAAIRRELARMLDGVKDRGAAEVFWAYYLEGPEQPSARSLANRFFVDKRTVFKQLQRVFDQLRVMLFGIDALFDLAADGRQ